MPTPLDRLLFAQGGKCFFCEEPLPRAEASVEHLVAQANGGPNHDGNCVACCKTLNALLGSMSLKEKIRAVLNQEGQFHCPKSGFCTTPSASQPTPPTVQPPKTPYEVILANLQGRGNSKPNKPKTLRSTIAAILKGAEETVVEAVVAKLKAAGKLTETETTVTYTF